MTMRWALMALMVSAVAACGPASSSGGDTDGGDTATNADAHRAMLTSLATHVYVPTVETFRDRAEDLEAAASTWATSDESDDRAAARDAWVAAAAVWQRAEMMQVGPAGVMSLVPGGEDLRDEIYSWPTTNACRVDQELVEQDYEDAVAFASQAVNVRGLDTLEYLLFHEGTDNACNANSELNTGGAWAAVPAAELDVRRADYAATVAVILADHAQALADSWTATGGFSVELGTAGAGSATFATAQAALNSVSDSLFYIDTEVKDMKLAKPAGLSDCAGTCPDDLESLYAHRSKEHVLANLQGLREVFTGGPAGEERSGFDDLLTDVGATELASDMLAAIDAAIAATEAVEGTFVDALGTDPASIVAIHTATKQFTDLLKSQMLTVLDLQLSVPAAGDND